MTFEEDIWKSKKREQDKEHNRHVMEQRTKGTEKIGIDRSNVSTRLRRRKRKKEKIRSTTEISMKLLLY